MKCKPLLFSAPMVRAILNDSKTQTRRVIKGDFSNPTNCVWASESEPQLGEFWIYNDDIPFRIQCPFGGVGDHIWVRETIWQWGRWVANGTTKTGRPKRKFKAVGQYAIYVADSPDMPTSVPDRASIHADEQWVKRPAIFMPRWACRIELEITKIGVERLCQISADDAMAEGIEPILHDGKTYWKNYLFISANKPHCHLLRAFGKPLDSYRTLWESINSKNQNRRWNANPWIWVIEFKKVSHE